MLHLVRRVFGTNTRLEEESVDRFKQMKNRDEMDTGAGSAEINLLNKMRDSQVRPAAKAGRRMIGKAAHKGNDRSSEIARSIGFSEKRAREANTLPAADLRRGF